MSRGYSVQDRIKMLKATVCCLFWISNVPSKVKTGMERLDGDEITSTTDRQSKNDVTLNNSNEGIFSQ